MYESDDGANYIKCFEYDYMCDTVVWNIPMKSRCKKGVSVLELKTIDLHISSGLICKRFCPEFSYYPTTKNGSLAVVGVGCSV